MYSYYEIIRCVKRIALPSPKQHALLNPIFFFLPFFLFFSSLLSSFLPIRFFFCSTTGDTSKRRGFRHNGILLARWSSAHVSFASFRACLNRGNRLSLYLCFLLALSLFFYSTPLPPLRFRLSHVVAATVQATTRRGFRWSKGACIFYHAESIARSLIKNQIRNAYNHNSSTQFAKRVNLLKRHFLESRQRLAGTYMRQINV